MMRRATFLDEFRASRAAGSSDEVRLTLVRQWLTSRPEALFEDLREHAPTFNTGGVAFVTRYHDVLDVLGRNDVFSVAPYGEAMKRLNRGPNFLLGMDDGPEYRRQLQLLGRVLQREDVERVRDLVATRVSSVLDAALVEGRLDLVDGFGRLVPALVVADYFGVPGPDPATLAQWARAIFADAFVNVLGGSLLTRRAMRASNAFRRYLDGLIEQTRAERASGVRRDDVIHRLLGLQEAGEPDVSDARIRDNLLWCIAGMIDNIDTALCRVMDLLLDDPALSKDAADAARAHDGERLRSLVFEALRFHTPTPVVTRRSLRTHIISRGTPHEKTIPAGTLTLVGVGAAMMDSTAIDDPKSFRMDRPPEHYLHFGAGLHQCLGTHLAVAHVTEMVARLVTLPVLRRAGGVAGRLRCTGPFPKGFVVEVRAPRGAQATGS